MAGDYNLDPGFSYGSPGYAPPGPQLSPYQLALLQLDASQAPPRDPAPAGSLEALGSLVGGGSGGAAASAPGASGSFTLPTQLGIGGPTAPASSLGALLPWLGVAGIGAGTAYSAYKGYQGAKNKGLGGGFKAGMQAAGPLNFVPVLGQAAWAAGALRGGFGGKKHKDQYQRDAVRKGLRESGFLDDKNTFGLADGSRYDIGLDGHRQYNVDMSRDGAGDNIGRVQALAHLLTGGGKPKDDLTGYITNGIMSAGDPRANAVAAYKDAGLDHDTAYGRVLADKTLDPHTRDAFLNGLDETFGVGFYQGGRTPGPPSAARNPGVQGRPMTPLSNAGPGPVRIPASLGGRPGKPLTIPRAQPFMTR